MEYTVFPWHPDRREGSRRKAAQRQRVRNAPHGSIVIDNANSVILTLSAQLRACSGQDRTKTLCAPSEIGEIVRGVYPRTK
jgi:hypothetical protein